MADVILAIDLSKLDKATVLPDEEYKVANIDEEKKPDIETLIKAKVLEFAGSTDDEKRANLPRLKKNTLMIHAAVGEVMKNLPAGVERVDGHTVRPLIDKIVNEEISKLPVPKEPKEII